MADIQFNGAARNLTPEQSLAFEARIDGVFEAASALIRDMSPDDQIITAFGYLAKVFASSAQARMNRLPGAKATHSVLSVAKVAAYHAGQALELLPTRYREAAEEELVMAMLQGSADHPFEAAMAAFNAQRGPKP